MTAFQGITALVESIGFFATARAHSPSTYEEFIAALADKGLEPRQCTWRRHPHDFDDNYHSGAWLVGGAVGTFQVWLSPPNHWGTNVPYLQWTWLDHNPDLCGYMEDCDCEDETCTYCEYGSDYCTYHVQYH